MADKMKKVLSSKAEKVALELSKMKVKLTEHIVESGETLSDIALKYYQHATPSYWKIILEANKAILSGNERNLQAGMKLIIPPLPDALKGWKKTSKPICKQIGKNLNQGGVRGDS